MATRSSRYRSRSPQQSRSQSPQQFQSKTSRSRSPRESTFSEPSIKCKIVKWLKEDIKLCHYIRAISKYSCYIDDHSPYVELIVPLTHVILIQRQKFTLNGWKNMYRQFEETNGHEHDDAWCSRLFDCKYTRGICKNVLYIKAEKLHLSTMASGTDLEPDDMITLWEKKQYCQRVFNQCREVNIIVSLSDLRECIVSAEAQKELVFIQEPVCTKDIQSNIIKTIGRVESSDGKVNPFGKIDNARFVSYDNVEQVVTIRVDDTHVPSFWMEIRIPMAQLNAFITNKEN